MVNLSCINTNSYRVNRGFNSKVRFLLWLLEYVFCSYVNFVYFAATWILCILQLREFCVFCRDVNFKFFIFQVYKVRVVDNRRNDLDWCPYSLLPSMALIYLKLLSCFSFNLSPQARWFNVESCFEKIIVKHQISSAFKSSVAATVVPALIGYRQECFLFIVVRVYSETSDLNQPVKLNNTSQKKNTEFLPSTWGARASIRMKIGERKLIIIKWYFLFVFPLLLMEVAASELHWNSTSRQFCILTSSFLHHVFLSVEGCLNRQLKETTKNKF